MRIAILVEGKTEKAFKTHLQVFLQNRLPRKMPKLDFIPYNGRIPTGKKLQRLVKLLLKDKKHPADSVIALTDLYTGAQPPEFESAEDAKKKMRQWVGKEKRFYPHVAVHDFDAWLLPYWEKIQKITGSNRTTPGPNPEQVNHQNPPAHRLAEVYLTGEKARSYIKAVEAGRILKGEDLMVAINACPELKAFVNTILKLCDETQVIKERSVTD